MVSGCDATAFSVLPYLPTLVSPSTRTFDHVFARRIHYAIEFPEPDASAREKIWRLSLPPNAPVSPDVPFGELARRFEIPGGAIKNVLSGAAYLAAAGDQPVGVGHIARALRREYAKMDRLYHRGELDSLLKSMS